MDTFPCSEKPELYFSRSLIQIISVTINHDTYSSPNYLSSIKYTEKQGRFTRLSINMYLLRFTVSVFKIETRL